MMFKFSERLWSLPLLASIKLLSLFLEPGKLLSYHVVLLLCSLDIFLINSPFYMFQDKCCWNIKHTVFL